MSSYMLYSSMCIGFIVISLKTKHKDAILSQNQHICKKLTKKKKKKEKKKKKKKKNFRPTDPNVFRQISGNTSNF